LVPNWVSKPSAVTPFGQAMTPALQMIRSKGLPAAVRPSAQARTLASEARSSSTNPSEPPFFASLRTCSVAPCALARCGSEAVGAGAHAGQRGEVQLDQ